MPNTAHMSEIAAESAYPQCADCGYFREDQADTGFCRFHKMYVLRTFDCPEFIARDIYTQGGEANPAQIGMV